MVIIETKEELVAQIQDAWEIIGKADEALESAKQALTEAHANLRQCSKAHHDTTAVQRHSGVDATSRVGTRTATKTSGMRRLSVPRQEYVLRPRRDASTGVSPGVDAEPGC